MSYESSTPSTQGNNWGLVAAIATIAVGVAGVLLVILSDISEPTLGPPILEQDDMATIVAESPSPSSADWLWINRQAIEQSAIANEPLAMAALVCCDGRVEPTWQIARQSPAGMAVLAACMEYLPDAAMQIELYHYLRAMAISSTPLADTNCREDEWPELRQIALTAMRGVEARRDDLNEIFDALAVDSTMNSFIQSVRNVPPTNSKVKIREFQKSYSLEDWANIETEMAAGSPAYGRRLFFELACYKCHPTSGPSGPLGPSLTEPSMSGNASDLFTAIINPNAKVDEAYRQYTAFVGGKVITGLLIDDADDFVVLSTDPLHDCEPVKIMRDELEEPLAAQKGSPMSRGMVDALSPTEIASLLLFLQSQDGLGGEVE